MAEELIQKWRRCIDRALPMNIFDTESEIAFIAEQASRSSFAVEFGSYLGCSTRAMREANDDLIVYCLDDWSDHGVWQRFQDEFVHDICAGKIVTLRGNTEESVKLLPDSVKFDMAFIDASHLYDGVKHDIQIARNVMERGVIFGHDYRRGLPEDGVNRAVHEAFPEGVYFPADSIWAYNLNQT